MRIYERIKQTLALINEATLTSQEDLNELKEKGLKNGITKTEITKAIGINSFNSSKIVSALQESNLIKKEKHHITITDLGRQLLKNCDN